MRKLFIAVMALSMMLAAADRAVLDRTKVNGYVIAGETSEYLDLAFSVGEISYSDVNTEKGVFSSVRIETEYLTMEHGSPALPSFHKLIAMPYGAEPEVDVLSYTSRVYKLSELGINNPIMPAQPSYSKSSKPEERLFVYNENEYKTSGLKGSRIATVSKSGTMRGIGVGNLQVNPFRYDPVAGTIEVLNDIQVRVKYIGADPSAEEIAAECYSPYFESAYSQLINYRPSSIKADLLRDPVTYLIVANSNLNGNADLERFIDWKTEKGFNVITNYVAASTTITTIDTWVENQWNTLSPKPSFILIIGDHDGTYGVLSEVNPPLGSTGSVTRSDLLYQVIGATSSSNRIPSMYAGRMSVRSTAELTAQVDKTIWYEKEQFSSVLNPGQDFTYLTRPLGVAGVDSGYAESHGDPQITYGWMHYFTSANGMAGAQYYLYPESDGSSVPAAIVSFMSAGSNFYNYTAHGAETVFADPSFTISNIDGLANSGEYPLVVGNCCLTGSFGTTECFGEAWLNAANKGAVGYIGASMSTYWDEDLAMGVGLAATNQQPPALDTAHPGMYDGVMALGYSSQAATRHVGLMAVEALGSGYTDDYWSSYQMFGDPSVQIYFGIPTSMTASHDGVIAPGATTFTVTTTPYAYVAMGDQDGNLHGAARANSSGVANVTISEYTVGDTGKLVITAQFKKPYFEDVLCTGSTGGNFAINQSSLSYGSVDAGSTSVQQFQISNSHGSEYLLGEITTPAGFSVAAATKEITKDVKNTISYSVAPGSSKTFDLTFAPTAGQTYSGSVSITSTDTSHPTASISVSGTGIVPEINLPVTSLDASAAPGNSTLKNFNIENQGQGTLNYSMSINYTSGKEAKGSGGPDTYGYKWIDSDETGGPVYNWIDITGTGTSVSLGDDALSAALNLGFTFNYYGTDFTTVKICSNGYLSFTTTATTYTNVAIPSSAEPNNTLALMWDDLNPSTGGSIYYYADAANSRFIVSYIGVPHYGTSSYNTAQAIIYASGKIVYQYQQIGASTETTATVGIENADGTIASQVVYNASYLKANLAIQFQATPEWLSLDSTSGSVPGSGSVQIGATCDAAELDYGVYTADITLTSNDGDEPSIVIPVTFTVTDVVEPDAPANVTTVSATSSEVNLGWDAVSGATLYHIYRSTTDPYSGFTEIGTSGTNSYQDTDVSTGNMYFYYITSDNAK